jgi:hypothetical protein
MEADGLRLAEELDDGETLADGLAELDGEVLAEDEGDRLAEAELEDELDGEADADGLAEADGDDEADGLTPATGEVPNQSTPGRTVGWPSSTKKMLVAVAKASFGRRDSSIRVITPRLKLPRVKKSGFGKSVGPLFCGL